MWGGQTLQLEYLWQSTSFYYVIVLNFFLMIVRKSYTLCFMSLLQVSLLCLQDVIFCFSISHFLNSRYGVRSIFLHDFKRLVFTYKISRFSAVFQALFWNHISCIPFLYSLTDGCPQIIIWIITSLDVYVIYSIPVPLRFCLSSSCPFSIRVPWNISIWLRPD